MVESYDEVNAGIISIVFDAVVQWINQRKNRFMSNNRKHRVFKETDDVTFYDYQNVTNLVVNYPPCRILYEITTESLMVRELLNYLIITSDNFDQST